MKVRWVTRQRLRARVVRQGWPEVVTLKRVRARVKYAWGHVVITLTRDHRPGHWWSVWAAASRADGNRARELDGRDVAPTLTEAKRMGLAAARECDKAMADAP